MHGELPAKPYYTLTKIGGAEKKLRIGAVQPGTREDCDVCRNVNSDTILQPWDLELPITAVGALDSPFRLSEMLPSTLKGLAANLIFFARVLFATPFFWIMITLDRFLAARGLSNPLLFGVPRNAVDIESRPHVFFRMLCKPKGTLPAGAQLVSLEREGGVAGEPGKNKSISQYKLLYRSEPGGVRLEKHIFVKYQSERAVSSLWLAFASAAQAEHREVAWYSHLAKHAPLKSPNFVSAHWSRVFSRVITVTELLPTPWATVTDWRSASAQQMLALVRAAATLHSTPGFSGTRLATGPAVFMAPASVKGFSGIDRTFQVLKVLVFLTCSGSKIPEYVIPLWDALVKYFEQLPVCVSHGDCRPGNHLFRPMYNNGAPAADVVFADWEALSITPVMWDFTYATVSGQSVVARRRNHAPLLQAYLATLVASGFPDACGGGLMLQACEEQYTLICIVIAYYGLLLGIVGGVGATQGNTTEDGQAWKERINCAILDCVAEFGGAQSVAKVLDLPPRFVSAFLATLSDDHGSDALADAPTFL